MTALESSLYTLAGVAVVLILMVLALTGGRFGRIGLAYRGFRKTLSDTAFGDKVVGLLEAKESKPTGPPKPSGAPLRLLGLLQPEGPLLHSFTQTIHAYADV